MSSFIIDGLLSDLTGIYLRMSLALEFAICKGRPSKKELEHCIVVSGRTEGCASDNLSFLSLTDCDKENAVRSHQTFVA